MTPNVFSLANVTRKSASLPDRIIIYATHGWGKTSFASRLPSPIFLMTPGEDRLKKLIEQGLCPETAHFPALAKSWDDVNAAVEELISASHDFRTFVIDTGNGAERLAQELVCAEEYKEEWGEYGFARFGQGEKVTADRLWMPFLNRLDHLRERRRMRIVLICHGGVQSVKNPEGGDYDKIVPALSKRSWSYTSKWADMILYGALELQIGKDEPKSKLAKNKAKGGRVRLLHCQPTAAYEAKNVHRLPPTIKLGDDPHSAYEKFRAAFPKPAKKPKSEEPAASSPVPSPQSTTDTTAKSSGSSSLKTLGDWMVKLRFTPADKEELCAQHGVQTLEEATDEMLQTMIADLQETFKRWQDRQREPGEEPPDES